MADIKSRADGKDAIVEHQEALELPTRHHIPEVPVVLHHDIVASEAVGGLYEMPKGYYWSRGFLGTLTATCLAQISGYLGWVLPANTLSLINASLGSSPNILWVATSWTLGFTLGFALVGRLSDST